MLLSLRSLYESTSSGSLTQTLGALSASGNVTARVSGSLAQTLGAAAASGTDTVRVSASLAKTLAALTSAGTGTVKVSASFARTLGAAAASSAATVRVAGSLTKTLGAATLAASGTVRVSASASDTLGTLTGSATSAVKVSASLAKTLGALTGFSTDTVRVSGSLSKTLGALAGSAVADVDVSGSLAQTLGALASAATDTVRVSASLAKTLGAVVTSGSLTVRTTRDATRFTRLGQFGVGLDVYSPFAAKQPDARDRGSDLFTRLTICGIGGARYLGFAPKAAANGEVEQPAQEPGGSLGPFAKKRRRGKPISNDIGQTGFAVGAQRLVEAPSFAGADNIEAVGVPPTPPAPADVVPGGDRSVLGERDRVTPSKIRVARAKVAVADGGLPQPDRHDVARGDDRRSGNEPAQEQAARDESHAATLVDAITNDNDFILMAA